MSARACRAGQRGPCRATIAVGGRTHYVEVRVFERRRGMVAAARRLLRATASTQELGGGQGGIAAGCFLPPTVSAEDPTVVVMLFSLEDLGREIVVHECYHAGWRLARFLGYSSSDDEFEEAAVTEGAALVGSVLGFVGRVRREWRKGRRTK